MLDTPDRLWILGAQDPEMDMIEELLRKAGECVIYAIDAQQRRVTEHTAYSAGVTASVVSRWQYVSLALAIPYYVVECGIRSLHYREPVSVIDHHRPGDPGYGALPGEFLAASSLGQVIRQLSQLGKLSWPLVGVSKRESGDQPMTEPYLETFQHSPQRKAPQWHIQKSMTECEYGLGPNPIGTMRIPDSVVFTAASDHCGHEAYRGQCPGVDPAALLHWRTHHHRQYCNQRFDAVVEIIANARRSLRVAVVRMDLIQPASGGPVAKRMPDAPFADMRDYVYDPHILYEAAILEGIPYLALDTGPCGRRRVLLRAVPRNSELVHRFVAGEVVPGLVDYFGDPVFGFAWGYLSKHES